MATFYASYPLQGSSSGVPTYANLAAFPLAASAGNGALAIALDTDILYISTGTVWEVLADPTISPFAITQLHGDGTATGPGNVALTLATVNGNVGTFGTAANVSTVTVNAKGLVTAASNTAIQIAESQVTNLVTDLAGKVPTSRLINTTSPLTGGGDLSADRTLAVTSGNLTDAGTDGITVTGGTGAVLGSGTSIAQHVSDSTHNGYLSSTDWSTFNSKQSALTLGDLTDAGTDGIIITGGSGAVVGSGTSLAQHVADTTHNGYLSSTDWNTFNGKQAAGSYITDLTGDVTAAGPGSSAATLATVNGNVGSFGDATHVGAFTVNAKGLITAASSVAITATALMNGNVRASEGGGTITLTNSDNQTQTWNLSAAETVKLPTTGIVKGDIWTMINPNQQVLTIQSSGANNIIKSWGSRVILQANVVTPTAAADWTVLEHVILQGRVWTDYTPTYSTGTGVTQTFFARWIRPQINLVQIEINTKFSGTNIGGSGNFTFTGPSFLQYDLTDYPDGTDSNLGGAKLTGSQTNNNGYVDLAFAATPDNTFLIYYNTTLDVWAIFPWNAFVANDRLAASFSFKSSTLSET